MSCGVHAVSTVCRHTSSVDGRIKLLARVKQQQQQLTNIKKWFTKEEKKRKVCLSIDRLDTSVIHLALKHFIF